MAKSRRRKGDNRGFKSWAGRSRNPARHSTVNLVIQIIALIRLIIDVLDH